MEVPPPVGGVRLTPPGGDLGYVRSARGLCSQTGRTRDSISTFEGHAPAAAAAIMRFVRSAADAAGAWTENGRSSRPGLATMALVFLAVTAMVGLTALSAAEGLLAWDVRFAYLPAAEAILSGDSPYPALDDPILEEQKGYVYPPQLLFALVPLTPLPVGVASALVAAGLVALLLLTLRVLEVRDVRCYAAALLWVPSISGVLLGNVSIPLAFALAVTWRYRDRVWPPAVALGLSVSAKLLLWPMFVWLAATRRLRTALVAVALGLLVTLASWAAIGFAGFTSYPDLLRELSRIQAERSYSFLGIAEELGLGSVVGNALVFVVGGALLVGCVLFARRDDDARSFTCAVAATLALSPIVWLHYLVALLVPMAILRPRFSALWLLPVLLWVSPKPGYAEGLPTVMPALAAGDHRRRAACSAALGRRGREGSGVTASTAALRQPRTRLGWEWLASAALLVAVAGALLTGLFTAYGPGDANNLGADFRAAYLPAAELVADGRSPYPQDPSNPPEGFPHYIYPPQLALAITPLTRTSDDVAAAFAVLVSLAALLGALAVLGVRDVRCYAVVVIWAPGWNALEMANVSAVLALLVALVWRFRDKLWEPATALALMISVKLFLWPLIVWAVATRRIALAGAAVLMGATVTLASWAAIGFAGLRTFPEVSRRPRGRPATRSRTSPPS